MEYLFLNIHLILVENIMHKSRTPLTHSRDPADAGRNLKF